MLAGQQEAITLTGGNFISIIIMQQVKSIE
jgi:hypothetical protein